MFLVIMGLFVQQMNSATYKYLVQMNGQDKLSEYRAMANLIFESNTKSFVLKFSNLAKELDGPVNFKELDRLFAQTREWEDQIKPDLFYYLDDVGKVLYPRESAASLNDLPPSVNLASLAVVKRALSGFGAGGLEVIPGEIIQREGLVEFAYIPEGSSGRHNLKDQALALVAAEPIFDGQKVAGVLVSCRILNNKSAMVDLLKKNFNVDSSIYLSEVVVSTNERTDDGKRAVGEIIPPHIAEKVLVNGTSYQGRDYLFHDFYIASFEPLKDLENRIIGALYVGIEEAPLLARQEGLYNEIRITLIILAAVFIFVILWLYKSIIQPVRGLAEAALRFARGDYKWQTPRLPNRCWEIKDCQVEACPVYGRSHLRCWLSPRKCRLDHLACTTDESSCEKCELFLLTSGNEIDHLTDAFNFMAASVQEHTESLYNLTIELESRTDELINQRDELEAQKEQLISLNSQLYESMKALDDSQSIIYALAVAVETKDQYTRGHSERVADYSVELARAMGKDAEELVILQGAAILHDIGKIGISDAILGHPGALNFEELQQIKNHPAIGERICSSLKFAQEMLPIILHHHEHYDGHGYPDGLQGDDIPILARVVAIADAYDAMTSDRPYRFGMPDEKALAILEQGAGTQWDPGLVRMFVEMIRTTKYDCQKRPTG